jgi:hypothetical protein
LRGWVFTHPKCLFGALGFIHGNSGKLKIKASGNPEMQTQLLAFVTKTFKRKYLKSNIKQNKKTFHRFKKQTLR